MKKLSKILLLVTSSLVLSNCSRNMDSNVYTSSSAVGKVLEGTVISATPITIKDSDNLQDNTIGMLAGGALGGVAASSVGGGSGQALATVGGAIVGAAVGAMVQDKLSTQKGMQYVIRLDPKYVSQNPQTVDRREYSVSSGNIDSDIKKSIETTSTRSDLLSVVQGDDVIIQPGQKVLIIYNNDRPRLTPINY